MGLIISVASAISIGVAEAASAAASVVGIVESGIAIGESVALASESAALLGEAISVGAETAGVLGAEVGVESAVLGAEIGVESGIGIAEADAILIAESESLLASGSTAAAVDSDLLLISETEALLGSGEAGISTGAEVEQLLADVDLAEAEFTIEGEVISSENTLFNNPIIQAARQNAARIGRGEITMSDVLGAIQIIGTGVQAYKENREHIDPVIDWIAKQVGKRGKNEVGKLIMTGPNGNMIDFNQDLLYVDPYQEGTRVGHIAAQMLRGMETIENRTAENVEVAALSSLSQVIPTLELDDVERAGKLYKYIEERTLDIPAYETTYLDITSVYTGDYKSEPYYDSEGNISILNELGEKITWLPEVGDVHVLGRQITIPTLHGRFVGPLSRNDGLPVHSDGSTDFLDTAAMLHDVSWSDNNPRFDNPGSGTPAFNRFSDWQFVSRLTHTLHLMRPIERVKARIAIAYFTSGGMFMQEFFDNTNTQDFDGVFNFKHDLYSRMIPQVNTTPTNEFEVKQLKELRASGKYYFDAGVQNGMTQGYHDLIEETIPTTPNNYILNAFDNLLVER